MLWLRCTLQGSLSLRLLQDIRLFITLECTEQKATGVAGISRYMTEKARVAAAVAPSAARRHALQRRRRHGSLCGTSNAAISMAWGSTADAPRDCVT